MVDRRLFASVSAAALARDGLRALAPRLRLLLTPRQIADVKATLRAHGKVASLAIMEQAEAEALRAREEVDRG